MKLIAEGRERDWYLVKEWTTKTGLKARIQLCKWKIPKELKITSLHDHYTGYVQLADVSKEVDNDKINVHGGVTFNGDLEGETGQWVGFDMAHYGDENIKEPLEYAIKECEELAKQLV